MMHANRLGRRSSRRTPRVAQKRANGGAKRRKASFTDEIAGSRFASAICNHFQDPPGDFRSLARRNDADWRGPKRIAAKGERYRWSTRGGFYAQAYVGRQLIKVERTAAIDKHGDLWSQLCGELFPRKPPP
jgi:hypothetical protein